MGCEIKLYIGRVVHSLCDKEKGCFFMHEAMINLYKQDYKSKLYNMPDAEPVYIYGADGDTPIYDSPYGQKLMAYDIALILKCLQDMDIKGYNISRAIMLIESYLKDDSNNIIKVLVYLD